MREEESGPTAADLSARELARGGDSSGAATILIREHGPGVLGWPWAMTSSAAEADDVFATVCERLWKTIPSFDWTRSPRTWLHVVGHNVVIDRARRARTKQEVPLALAPPIAALVASTTADFRTTTAKDRLQQLRQALDPEDRTLLILRVDRQLSWIDIARVLDGSKATDAHLRRTSARIRKRFERLKVKLRDQWESDQADRVTSVGDRVVASRPGASAPPPADDDGDLANQ